MNDIKLVLLTVTISISALLIFNGVESCNEAVCASVVSKCMLTQSCKCDLKNCSCCQECFTCLSYLYTECCSCVDMCPKPNDTGNALSRKSHVEDFQEPIPDLFQALMAEPDTLERWHTFTYPVDFDISIYRPKIEKEIKILTHSPEDKIAYYYDEEDDMDHEIKEKAFKAFPILQIPWGPRRFLRGDKKKKNNEQEVAPRKDIVTLNCTVAFMSQCMSWNKCKSSCQSTGASKYRWFHDGCCECIGHTCINYGINESRCMKCPLTKEDSPEDKTAYYYDEEDDIDHGIEEKAFKQVQAEAHRVSYNP